MTFVRILKERIGIEEEIVGFLNPASRSGRIGLPGMKAYLAGQLILLLVLQNVFLQTGCAA